MFSDVVLSPEAEYAKKIMKRRHVLALESKKGVKSATKREPQILEYGAVLCQAAHIKMCLKV